MSRRQSRSVPKCGALPGSLNVAEVCELQRFEIERLYRHSDLPQPAFFCERCARQVCEWLDRDGQRNPIHNEREPNLMPGHDEQPSMTTDAR